MDMDLTPYFSNVGIAWVVVLSIITAVHFGLWASPWRLAPPTTYVVGVLILLVGCLVWGLKQSEYGAIDPRMAVLAFWIIASPGLILYVFYWARGCLRLIEERGRKKAVVSRTLEEIGEAHDQE
jgi:hypothetical protein